MSDKKRPKDCPDNKITSADLLVLVADCNPKPEALIHFSACREGLVKVANEVHLMGLKEKTKQKVLNDIKQIVDTLANSLIES